LPGVGDRSPAFPNVDVFRAKRSFENVPDRRRLKFVEDDDAASTQQRRVQTGNRSQSEQLFSVARMKASFRTIYFMQISGECIIDTYLSNILSYILHKYAYLTESIHFIYIERLFFGSIMIALENGERYIHNEA